jgi:hypothetical protein
MMLFSLPGGFIVIAPKGGTSRRNQFGTAVFNQIASFGDHGLQDFENLAYSGFPVNELSKGSEMRGVFLDGASSAQRPGRRFISLYARYHTEILCLFEAENKGLLAGGPLFPQRNVAHRSGRSFRPARRGYTIPGGVRSHSSDGSNASGQSERSTPRGLKSAAGASRGSGAEAGLEGRLWISAPVTFAACTWFRSSPRFSPPD